MKITQHEFLTILRDRFGDDPMEWAFECPNCGDVATGRDFRQALTEHPRERRDGTRVTASDVLGRECIGRTLGALGLPALDWQDKVKAGEARGCDWTAYGLFLGPLIVVMADGQEVGAFPPAKAPTPEATS